MPPDTHYPMYELLMRHGVDPPQARAASISQLRNWEVDDVENILKKVKRPTPDYCLFRSAEVKPSKPPPKPGVDDPWEHVYKYWPTLWATKPIPISPPRALIEQSAKDGTALCVNVKGEWSLRSEGYCALSHVWIEGLQRDESIGGLEKTKIIKAFELLKRAGLSSEWIWTDVLVIPGGWPTQSLQDEMITVAKINSMPQVYGQAEAVLIFDATVLQIHSTDHVEVAVALACGKWATRVWTYQEIKLANRAVVVTATGGVEFSAMIATLKLLSTVDEERYKKLYVWMAIMAKSDQHRLTIRDLASACAQRKSGMDIDYARAFFPVLGLEWTNGMTREQGMQMIYRRVPSDSVAIAAFAGSPRMKLNPGWAPSYLTNLEGMGSEHLKWERRGIRGEWYILKIKKLLNTTRPRYGKIGLDLEVECNITPNLQCVVGPNEEPEVIEAVKTMIGRGYAYILSVNTFATFSKEWARSVLIVEKANTAAYHGMEVAAHCAATIGSPGEHREERKTLLIRHGNPNVELDLPNSLQYHWFCEEETNKPTDLPREDGESPLHVAVRNGNLAKVEELVAKGDSIEAYDAKGRTPLHVAAARGGIEVLDFLAKKAPNIEIPCNDTTKDTPLVLAARRGKSASINVLLDNGAPIEGVNGGDYTPLMCASYECHEDAVEALLKRGANTNSKDSGNFSGSPLLLASGRNDLGVQTMRLLVKYGADVNPTFHRLGWTPLLKASDTGNDGEVEYLLSVGANPNVKDYAQRTPLRYAIHHARERSVRMLLDSGADRQAVFDDELRPVHLAAICGNYKIMQMLLEKDIDVNVRAADKLRRGTPLHLAVLKGQATVVKMLLSKGAEVNAQNALGKTPLDHAIEQGDTALQTILKAAGGKATT
jgi:ankyrin repeat protein